MTSPLVSVLFVPSLHSYYFSRKFLFFSSYIYLSVCLFVRGNPEVLSHCGHGHDLTSVASVINIADIRSDFVEALASERFCKNSADDVP